MNVDVRFNVETKKYDVVDGDTGTPLLHGSRGNRIDGGGHDDQSTAERQRGHLQKWYNKKEKETMA